MFESFQLVIFMFLPDIVLRNQDNFNSFKNLG